MRWKLQLPVLVVLVSYLGLSTAQTANYVDCGSYFTMGNLTISGCTSENYCIFIIGEHTTVSFDIDSGFVTVDSLVNDVSFHIRGVTFSLKLTPPEPCEVLLCPIQQNYVTKYSADVFVDERFASTYADIKWIMKSPDDKQVLCWETPVVLLTAGQN